MNKNNSNDAKTTARRSNDLKPDPEMWKALEYGEKLTAILTDFYIRVYEDVRLAHFFEGVTRPRAVSWKT